MAWIVRAFGRRASDPYIAIDWYARRAIRRIRLFSELTNARKLETIEYDLEERCVAIGLLSHGWGDWYFLNERGGWEHDQYFELADTLFVQNSVDPMANWAKNK